MRELNALVTDAHTCEVLAFSQSICLQTHTLHSLLLRVKMVHRHVLDVGWRMDERAVPEIHAVAAALA